MPPAERQRWVRRYREGDPGLQQFAEVHGLRASQLHYRIYGKRGSKTPKATAALQHMGPTTIITFWLVASALTSAASIH